MEKPKLTEVEYLPIAENKRIIKFNPSNKQTRSDTIFLNFVVLTAVLLQLEASAFWIWTSPAVVQMQSEDANINPLGRTITTTEISLLVGVPGYVSLIGGVTIPILSDLIGRKKSLQILGLVLILSAVALAFSTNVYLMVIFLALFQIVTSGIWGILPVYITEICEDHNRAKYGCILSVFSPLGQLYGYATGPSFTLRTFTLILAAPLVFFEVGFLFAPESPVYALSKGRKEECMKTLKKLRSNKTDIELIVDFNKINKSLIEESKSKEKRLNLVKLFALREGRMGLYLAALPILAQYFSGVPVIMPLLGPTFNELGFKWSGNTIAIIIGVFKVCTFLFTSLIIEKTGRRWMLICSSLGSGVMVTIVGVSFYLKAIELPVANKIQYVTLTCVILYVIVYSLGLGPIPVAVMTELFSPELRSAALSFLSISTSLVLSGYTSIFPILTELIGTYSCLWIFGASCFIQAIIFIVVFPETKGKSIDDIQEMLKNYKFRK